MWGFGEAKLCFLRDWLFFLRWDHRDGKWEGKAPVPPPCSQKSCDFQPFSDLSSKNNFPMSKEIFWVLSVLRLSKAGTPLNLQMSKLRPRGERSQDNTVVGDQNTLLTNLHLQFWLFHIQVACSIPWIKRRNKLPLTCVLCSRI